MKNIIFEDLAQRPAKHEVENRISSTPIACNSQLLKTFQKYYNAKVEAAGGIPSRRDISPTDIPKLLEHVYLVDLCGDPDGGAASYHYRVLGSKIARLIGQDLSQKSLTAYHCPNRRARSAFVYAYVVNNKLPARIIGRVQDSNGQSQVIETINYPLSSDGENVDMIIGALGFLRI